MDKIEQLFINIVDQNRREIAKVLKECVLQELVVGCTEIFYRAQAKGEDLSQGQLFKMMIEEINKRES